MSLVVQATDGPKKQKTLRELEKELCVDSEGVEVWEALISGLRSVVSPDALFDAFRDLEGAISRELVSSSPLHASGAFGQLARRCVLNFKVASFEATVQLYDAVEDYLLEYDEMCERDEENFLNGASLGAEDMSCDGGSVEPAPADISLGTSQLEQLAQGILRDLPRSLGCVPFPAIDKALTALQEKLPLCHTVHFLRYVNSLQHRLADDAGSNLRSFHDGHQQRGLAERMASASSALGGPSEDGLPDLIQHASLALASLHSEMRHVEDALQAVEESIRVAQEASDASCLCACLYMLSLILLQSGLPGKARAFPGVWSAPHSEDVDQETEGSDTPRYWSSLKQTADSLLLDMLSLHVTIQSTAEEVVEWLTDTVKLPEYTEVFLSKGIHGFAKAADGAQGVVLEPELVSSKFLLRFSQEANVGPELEKSFVYISLDRDRVHYFPIATVLHKVQPADLQDAVWKLRWMALYTLSHLGINSLVLDSDIVVLSDPFRALHGDADIEISTDLFKPELDLFDKRLRHDDNLNTGCIFAQASKLAEYFLLEFLEEHDEPMIAGIQRDPMDQRVFARFVMHHVSQTDTDRVLVVYGVDQARVFRNAEASRKVEQPLRIRVLDPVVFAHGMNYFWLRAHMAPGREKTVAIAHANGVNDKEYFLRDRGLWYFDDFHERFGPEANFLTYEHPTGLSLGDDFQHFAEAITVAIALERRLVMPNTMNCDNCPALEPYGANATLRGGNCTFDYFANIQVFIGTYKKWVAESGLARHPEFLYLPSTDLPSGSNDNNNNSSAEIQQAVEDIRNGMAADHKWSQVRRLHVADIRSAYTAILATGFEPKDVHHCQHHSWFGTLHACRDEQFVAVRGESARCEPEPGQAGCGYQGFDCCHAVWGWSDKLEYFTGRRWDLPCNCGLSTCQAASPPETTAFREQSCCSHVLGSPAAYCDEAQPPPPEVNADLQVWSLQSPALKALTSNPSGGAAVFWRLCRAYHYNVVNKAAEALQNCDEFASRYLLVRQDLEALAAWWRFEAELPWRAHPAVPLHSFDPSGAILQPGTLTTLAAGFQRQGFAVADNAIQTPVLLGLENWMARIREATGKGAIQQTTLEEGLHCEALLLLAQEILASDELQSSIASEKNLTLDDIWVWKLLREIDTDTPVHYSRPVPDVLVVVWLGEARGSKPRGIALQGQEGDQVKQLVIPYARNRLVMWRRPMQGIWLLKGSQVERRRADLVLSFRRSSGRRGFPGITDFTAARWPKPFFGHRA
ncbi:unnamed protein product [Polarella glacialis]|uniref:Anaphase-promoting complex subunit 5 n=1 Tax=Polarella glacialis TaxID=89957 RepID=A0A813HWL8_POLGL|nr:unnamed protein product [Polarella glacialis]